MSQDEIKRRIHAARLLRNISQTELNRRGAEDGFGREEMGRVERGELEFRPGKHLDPLCRYLNVPRWWFTAEVLYFGAADAPASPDEVASLLAQQNDLLARQSQTLMAIESRLAEEREVRDGLSEMIERRRQELVAPASAPDPKPAPPPSPAAGSTRATRQRTP